MVRKFCVQKLKATIISKGAASNSSAYVSVGDTRLNPLPASLRMAFPNRVLTSCAILFASRGHDANFRCAPQANCEARGDKRLVRLRKKRGPRRFAKEKGHPRAALIAKPKIVSALGELEALAGLGAAELLAFHDAAVAGQETCRLQRAPQGRFIQLQRLGDAVLDRTGLTRQTATLHGGHNVEFIVDTSD